MLEGILSVVAASLLFGMKPTSDKYVMLSGVAPVCITFYGQLILTVLALALTRLRRECLKIERSAALYLIFLGAIGMGVTSFLISSAMECISVGLATILHFLYPTIVSIAMVTLFHQKLTKFKFIAIVCSIGGMLLITNISGDAKVSATGVLLALASSLTYSFYMIANDKGKVNELSLLVKLVYSGFGSALLFGILSAAQGEIRLPGTWRASLVMLLVSGIGNLGAFYFITAGIRRIGASAASFVNMLEPITSVVVSTVIYQDHQGFKTICGMALILSSVLLVAMDGRKGISGESRIC